MSFDALTPGLMLRAMPGVFCVGEMLDWEAPTGGYLLTACMAGGLAVADGVAAYLGAPRGIELQELVRMDGLAGAARGARSLTTWPTTGGAPSWARMPMTRVTELASTREPWPGS